MSGKYLTIAEIAERWICSKDYVRKLIISGQLSGTKLGGWKVRQDELLRYEKAKEKRDMEELRVQRVGFFPGA
ncbi:helix-turn-helix domain-containing protein [Agathobaculum sp.]|mgnify:FL=1|uniref:helix-turn-helix domain-containing protein n=1 Tax=Agathobaculum sp. TaxID=2048138 RepID=UPI001C3B7E91|nr:helix-turn-helix domain-containing protein [Agathobaculum sp.]HIS96183.1 excisionase family DNA-binding protein [Candidatus Ventricola gallistercoris]HIX10236.1 excisionase family DNA-binding protein [Candidatus Agathobaculum pullistercoris]